MPENTAMLDVADLPMDVFEVSELGLHAESLTTGRNVLSAEAASSKFSVGCADAR